MSAVILASRPLKVVYARHTDQCAWSLRLYTSSYAGKNICPAVPGEYSYCNASVFIGNHPTAESHLIENFSDDPRWPVVCEACGRPFAGLAEVERQIFTDTIMAADDGRLVPFREWSKIPGAMWDKPWWHGIPGQCGADGLSLSVVCPDGQEWNIDGNCSNCDRKGTPHKCWPRAGTPPNIDVAKHHGPTCSAGAGSVITDHWHGFLRNGFLIDC